MTTSIQNHNKIVDTVIHEVRRTKERLARKFDYDVRRIAADARARQYSSGHEVVSRVKPKA
jgi:hypothetical protein